MLKLKGKQYNPGSQKYYNRIIQSYQQNNENFSRKNQDLLSPEQLNIDSDEYREEQKKIILSKKNSMSPQAPISIDNQSSPDDVFSHYLRELTMAPNQFKKHENTRVNQQIFEQIKSHIQKTVNTSDPEKLIEYVVKAEQSVNQKNQNGQMSEFTLLRKATLKQNLEKTPLQSNSQLQTLIMNASQSADSNKSKSPPVQNANSIDYQKLAQQVRRLSYLHSFKIQRFNQKQASGKLRSSITKAAILEEDEGDVKESERNQNQKRQSSSQVNIHPSILVAPLGQQNSLKSFKPQKVLNFQCVSIEPQSRKIQLKKELKEKSLQKLKEYHELKKKLSGTGDFDTELQQISEKERSQESQRSDSSNKNSNKEIDMDQSSNRNNKGTSRKNSARVLKDRINRHSSFLRKSATIKIEDEMEKQPKELLPPMLLNQSSSKGLRVGDCETPDYSFIFKMTEAQDNITLPRDIDDRNFLTPIQEKSDQKSSAQKQGIKFSLNLKPVIKKLDPMQPEDSKRFGEKLKQNLRTIMKKTHSSYFRIKSPQSQSKGKNTDQIQTGQDDDKNIISEVDSSFSSGSNSLQESLSKDNPHKRQKYMELINQKKLQLFDDLLETVDARLRESIMSQQQLFTQSPFNPQITLSNTTPLGNSQTNFFNKRNLQTQSSGSPSHQLTEEAFFPFPMSPEMMKSKSLIKLQNEQVQKPKKHRIKTFKVEMTRNQFNIANLPYIKYGPEILQDRNYQFKIIKDEMSILHDKFIEFKTQLTYKYSFQSSIVFQTMGKETQKRFNIQFEELIGFIIEVIHIVLLKFGDDPDRIGLKDYSKVVEQTVKVRSEATAFRDNQTLFIDLTDMFKKSFDAYYIMTKMLGFSQIHYDENQKLMQYICRARLSCKELMQDFRYQEELLNREFQKEKMYIESMLMRGEDLYQYKYRQKLDNSTIQALNNKEGGKDTDSYQYIHHFLEQQSMAYAKKLKKIQQDYQSKQHMLEKKKLQELEKEKREKELAENPNQYIIDPKFMESIQREKEQKRLKKEKKKQGDRHTKSQTSLYPQRLNQFGLPFFHEEPPKLKGKLKYKVDAKIQTQPQFTGKQALDLKLQIKEVMKNMRNMANQKVPKQKERHERKDSYDDMDANALKPPPQREPENYISNETREYISNSINKNKLKSAGFLHPAQLEKMIYLENEDDEVAKINSNFKKKSKEGDEILLLHSKSELKALKEVEKAVRTGLQSCKEVNKMQAMSQSLRDIVYMSNPIRIKKAKKRHPEARQDDE